MKHFKKKKKWGVRILALLGIAVLISGCVLLPGISSVYADTKVSAESSENKSEDLQGEDSETVASSSASEQKINDKKTDAADNSEITENKKSVDSDKAGQTDSAHGSSDTQMKKNSAQTAELKILSRLSNFRKIAVQVSWKQDGTEGKPKYITCTLFSNQSKKPLETFKLSAANASKKKNGAIVWARTLSDQYPVYNEKGDVISYHIEAKDPENNDYSVTIHENQNMYQNLDFYVPSKKIQEGESYLLADADEGRVSLYKSAPNQTGSAGKITASVISGDSYVICGTDGKKYQTYIASQRPEENKTAYTAAMKQITWTAHRDASGAYFLVNMASREKLAYPAGDSPYVLFQKTVPKEMPVKSAETEFSLTRKEDSQQETGNKNNITTKKSFVLNAKSSLNSTDSSKGKRTITISKTWTGENGDTSKRPDSLEFILYTDDPSKPLKTVTLTASNAVDDVTWKYTLPETYPIYDSSGKMIEYHMIENISSSDTAYYRLDESSSSSTLQTGYSGTSVYVPVTKIEDGTDYLVADSSAGAVKLLRAEASQTDGVLTTAEGAVNVLSDRTLTGEDGSSYSRYILIKGAYYKTLGGQPVYDTDFMIWKAHAQNGGAVLTSNAYRLWGLEDSNNENQYQGFLTYSGKKWKITKADNSSAGADSLFSYDASTGGFRTGNGQTVYLFKKVSVQDDLSDQAESTFTFTNYRYSDVMDSGTDPAPTDDVTDIHVEKQWDDQEDHSNDTVTIALRANGKEVRRIQVNASSDWKGTFENLPAEDASGNEISYSLKEISAVGKDGEALDYQMAEAGASDASVRTEKIWLPVNRPDKTAGGEEYVVICWPNNVNGGGSSLTNDGSGSSAITRTALTADSSGKNYALGEKNAGNVGGTGSLGITLQTTPITVGGKTYASYIKDADVTDTHKWVINYAGTGVIPENGSYVRDLFTFQSSISKRYLSTQGAMTLQDKADTREKFAYGFPLGDANWPQSKHLEKQGYTADQVAHMICAMDHYTIRTNQSPGGFNDEHYGNTGLYLYKAVTHTTKSFVLVNRKTKKTSVTVQKEWSGDSESNRPESVSMELYRNGQATGKTVTLSKDSGWKGSFRDLDILDSVGVAYQYSVVEVSRISGYTPEYGEISKDDSGQFHLTVTNKYKQTVIHMPETGRMQAVHMLFAGLLILSSGAVIWAALRRNT